MVSFWVRLEFPLADGVLRRLHQHRVSTQHACGFHCAIGTDNSLNPYSPVNMHLLRQFWIERVLRGSAIFRSETDEPLAVCALAAVNVRATSMPVRIRTLRRISIQPLVTIAVTVTALGLLALPATGKVRKALSRRKRSSYSVKTLRALSVSYFAFKSAFFARNRCIAKARKRIKPDELCYRTGKTLGLPE